MASNDLEGKLRIVISLLTDSEKLTDQLIREHNPIGDDAVQIFETEMDEVKQTNQDVKDELYELFLTHYDGDDLFGIPFPQLQQELFRVIRTKEPQQMVGFLEALQTARLNIRVNLDRIYALMENFNIKPQCRGLCLGREGTYLRPRKPTSGEKSMELDRKIMKPPMYPYVNMRLEARNVAIHMYGFPGYIASDIQDSLGHRKLIKNHTQFDGNEATIGFLDVDDEKDSDRVNWVRVHTLKHRFQELKKKIFKNKDGKVLTDAMAGPGDGKVNAETLRATFRKVIRNWVFHIEDVLFDSIIYELYYKLARNERAEAIFEEYRGTWRELRDNNQGMVPIAVHKAIYMMENPIGTEENGVVTRTPTVPESIRVNLDQRLGLEEMMEQIHGMMLRLRGLVFTSALSFTDKIIHEEEAALYEHTLEQLEEEIREIERKIKRAMSE